MNAPHRNGWALEAGNNKPNWVSSQSTEMGRQMAPLPFADSAEEVFQKLKDYWQSKRNAKIEREEFPWLHVICRTPLMRFTDDIILFVDDSKKQIDFMSASRLGYRDFEANRNRMSKFCKNFSQTSKT